MKTGFSVLSQQVNIFPTRSILNDVGKVAANILRLQVFDGTPNILPINGTDFPAGVVIVSLKSKNGDLACDISNDKISLTWLNIENKKDAIASSLITDITLKVLDSIFDHSETYKRIGYIASIGKFLEHGYTEGAEMVRVETSLLKLPNADKLRRFHAFLTYDFSLTTHENCYNVITVGTVNKAFGNKEEVFAIQQDICTKPNDNWSFKKEFIGGFIKEAETFSSINKITAQIWQD